MSDLEQSDRREWAENVTTNPWKFACPDPGRHEQPTCDDADNARWQFRIDMVFGAFWIVLAVAVLLVPRQDLWPALVCVGWAALGGFVIGQTVQQRREGAAS